MKATVRKSASAVFFLSLLLLCFSCGSSKKEKADYILFNAKVYTVDSVFSVKEAFAVKEGKFLATGSKDELLRAFETDSLIDAGGKAVFPGFIDAHCHFYNYGLGLKEVDLVGTKSFDEVVERVTDYAKKNPEGWIVGRGWDQNDWEVKEYPSREKLDKLFPERPIFLKRIDGHAALANKKALRLAGVNSSIKMKGGSIEHVLSGDYEDWNDAETVKELKHMTYPGWSPTGVLIDNAVDLVERIIPPPSTDEMKKALLAAQQNCFAVGLTTVDDAGLMKNVIDAMDSLHKTGEFKMRVYAMLSDSAPNYDYYLQRGPYKTERLNVCSFKFYGDGALGSRGACLKEDYADKNEWKGFLLNSVAHYENKYGILEKGLITKGFKWQFNVHAIGDSTMKAMMTLFNCGTMKPSCPPQKSTNPSLLFRNRIEHCQIYSPELISFYHSIPSVQPTHATSDMYWAQERLGAKRIKYAYAYKTLLKNAGVIALGTDFPVEDISPFKTFYAAVVRKDAKGFPEGGFQVEEALTREETIKGMTIWAAYSNFEEREKGSIEKGKFADFVILDTDLMKAEEKEILGTKVLFTYLNGEKVYGVN